MVSARRKRGTILFTGGKRLAARSGPGIILWRFQFGPKAGSSVPLAQAMAGIGERKENGPEGPSMSAMSSSTVPSMAKRYANASGRLTPAQGPNDRYRGYRRVLRFSLPAAPQGLVF